MQITVSVQFMVQLDKVFEAHYRLQDAGRQINSYVFDVVRATVPRQNLDEVFESKEEIATAVKEELRKSMVSTHPPPASQPFLRVMHKVDGWTDVRVAFVALVG